MSRVLLYKHRASKYYNPFDILEDIQYTSHLQCLFHVLTDESPSDNGMDCVFGLRVKHHKSCFGDSKWDSQKKLHGHRGKSVMVTSNIEKNCYGYIKHWENLLWSHQYQENLLWSHQTFWEKLLWLHRILRGTVLVTSNWKHFEKNC